MFSACSCKLIRLPCGTVFTECLFDLCDCALTKRTPLASTTCQTSLTFCNSSKISAKTVSRSSGGSTEGLVGILRGCRISYQDATGLAPQSWNSSMEIFRHIRDRDEEGQGPNNAGV